MAKTVMVVDDHASVGDVIGQMLRVLGHRVEVFVSPSDCLAWLERNSPDVAFVDMRMPGIDGVTLLSAIRDQGHEFPVVAITGYPESDLVQEARELGASAVAAKPVSMDILQGLVELS